MQNQFPVKFTLESGTLVEVTNTAGNTYHFSLTKAEGTADNFTYTEDDRPRDEIEDTLDFDQLNALRAFWLKREDII